MKLAAAIACCVTAIALSVPPAAAVGKGQGTKVVCVSSKTSHRVYRKKPKSCAFHRHGEPLAEAFMVRTKHDHWHMWHRGHARAKGREVTSMGHTHPTGPDQAVAPGESLRTPRLLASALLLPKVGHGSTMRLDACA